MSSGHSRWQASERVLESAGIAGRKRHAEHRAHAANGPEGAKCLDLTPEAAFDAAQFVVQRFITVHAHGDDDLRVALSCNTRRRPGDRVGEKAVGRKVQDDEPLPGSDDAFENLADVLAQEDLAAGQVEPRDLAIAIDEVEDFLGGQLVDGFALPDIAASCSGTDTSR